MGNRGELNNSEHDYMFRSHTMCKADKFEINHLGLSEYPVTQPFKLEENFDQRIEGINNSIALMRKDRGVSNPARGKSFYLDRRQGL